MSASDLSTAPRIIIPPWWMRDARHAIGQLHNKHFGLGRGDWNTSHEEAFDVRSVATTIAFIESDQWLGPQNRNSEYRFVRCVRVGKTTLVDKATIVTVS